MTDYANPNPLFQPAMRIIASITKGNPTIIETTFAHQYQTGLIVRVYIPDNFGMQQIDQLYGPIIVTSPTTFTISIDSTLFDDLTVPASPLAIDSSPLIVPIGEVNSQLAQATRNVLG